MLFLRNCNQVRKYQPIKFDNFMPSCPITSRDFMPSCPIKCGQVTHDAKTNWNLPSFEIFSQSDFTIPHHDIQLCRDTWHFNISSNRNIALNDILFCGIFGISQNRPQWLCFTRNFHLSHFCEKRREDGHFCRFWHSKLTRSKFA